MTPQTTEGFTAADYADHVVTYRYFVRGITTAAITALIVLIVLAYATMG